MTYLATIIEFHKQRAASDPRSADQALELVKDLPKPPSFKGAIEDAKGLNKLALIAEIKRGSPSKGRFDTSHLLPIQDWASTYQAAGANCISVLTDSEHFYAETTDLKAASSAGVPILRKDFTVCELDVIDTRSMGASCVLLIASVLDKAQLSDLFQLAQELQLDALIEVHAMSDIEKLEAINAEIVGINQRNLETFEVDSAYAAKLASLLDDNSLKIAESGINGVSDARKIKVAGFDGILVGESIVTSADPASKIRELVNI